MSKVTTSSVASAPSAVKGKVIAASVTTKANTKPNGVSAPVPPTQTPNKPVHSVHATQGAVVKQQALAKPPQTTAAAPVSAPANQGKPKTPASSAGDTKRAAAAAPAAAPVTTTAAAAKPATVMDKKPVSTPQRPPVAATPPPSAGKAGAKRVVSLASELAAVHETPEHAEPAAAAAGDDTEATNTVGTDVIAAAPSAEDGAGNSLAMVDTDTHAEQDTPAEPQQTDAGAGGEETEQQTNTTEATEDANTLPMAAEEPETSAEPSAPEAAAEAATTADDAAADQPMQPEAAAEPQEDGQAADQEQAPEPAAAGETSSMDTTPDGKDEAETAAAADESTASSTLQEGDTSGDTVIAEDWRKRRRDDQPPAARPTPSPARVTVTAARVNKQASSADHKNGATAEASLDRAAKRPRNSAASTSTPAAHTEDATKSMETTADDSEMLDSLMSVETQHKSQQQQQQQQPAPAPVPDKKPTLRVSDRFKGIMSRPAPSSAVAAVHAHANAGRAFQAAAAAAGATSSSSSSSSTAPSTMDYSADEHMASSSSSSRDGGGAMPYIRRSANGASASAAAAMKMNGTAHHTAGEHQQQDDGEEAMKQGRAAHGNGTASVSDATKAMISAAQNSLQGLAAEWFNMTNEQKIERCCYGMGRYFIFKDPKFIGRLNRQEVVMAKHTPKDGYRVGQPQLRVGSMRGDFHLTVTLPPALVVAGQGWQQLGNFSSAKSRATMANKDLPLDAAVWFAISTAAYNPKYANEHGIDRDMLSALKKLMEIGKRAHNAYCTAPDFATKEKDKAYNERPVADENMEFKDYIKKAWANNYKKWFTPQNQSVDINDDPLSVGGRFGLVGSSADPMALVAVPGGGAAAAAGPTTAVATTAPGGGAAAASAPTPTTAGEETERKDAPPTRRRRDERKVIPDEIRIEMEAYQFNVQCAMFEKLYKKAGTEPPQWVAEDPLLMDCWNRGYALNNVPITYGQDGQYRLPWQSLCINIGDVVSFTVKVHFTEKDGKWTLRFDFTKARIITQSCNVDQDATATTTAEYIEEATPSDSFVVPTVTFTQLLVDKTQEILALPAPAGMPGLEYQGGGGGGGGDEYYDDGGASSRALVPRQPPMKQQQPRQPLQGRPQNAGPARPQQRPPAGHVSYPPR